jgi:hypothetical protein
MSLSVRVCWRRGAVILLGVMLCASVSAQASGADQIYFAATDNITDVLVQKINAETVRIDMSCWYLTEHSISIALINRFHAGVPIRLIGDRGSIFEIDKLTKNEFYWLANQGVPIRLRFNPTWYPEIDHMKMTLFAGQNLVAFGSANYTPFELAPASSTNYKDETVLLTDDTSIVNAFRTKFDRIWNDTTAEPESLVPTPPYMKNWNDACVNEPMGCDFFTLNPNPAPMVINTARLEPDYPMPADLIWGQGPDFNNRLVLEINREPTEIDFVIYRLTVDNITDALLSKFRSGVPMKLIIEPNEYLNRKWPEFWLTHANIDKLWAAGIPIKWRTHDGLTHMKTIVTSTYVTNASSNYAAAWQRDDDYFISAAAKPAIYQAIKDRVIGMWNNTSAFAPFQPQPPDVPIQTDPVSDVTGVATTTPLVWKIAPFAVSYDVYMGISQANMTLVGNVPAQLVNNPPSTYSWTPPAPLQPGTRYVWKVVSRTNATPVNASLVASSSIWAFTTAGSAGPPAAPTTPSPSDAAIGVGATPVLGWSAGAVGTTFTVSFGTNNPPAQVVSGLTTPSYQPGTLAPATTYYWRVTAVSGGGTTVGPVWSFTTASGGSGPASDIVLYASDVIPHGTVTTTTDPTAAAGIKLTSVDNGVAALTAPLANPANYFDATFPAQGGTRYRVWFRIHAIDDSKWNDSFFVQFSDSVDAGGSPTYRIGTPGGYIVNLWTCSTCQSFGWGWQRNAYWLADSGDVWFQNSGSHTLRAQIREDGFEIDQIVLSPITYATDPPGPVSLDSTIVPKPSSPVPPADPGSPNPADGATGVSPSPTFAWSASGATSYDISFGTATPPPLLVSGASSAAYTPPSLTNGTTYYWQIVARNASGSTTGAIWSFTTAVAAPATPNSPSPANGATGQLASLTLTWAAAGATTYDVLFGPTDPPSQVASGISAASYAVSGLTAGATYFWQIVAHNAGGANQGPEWSFTTAVPPPSAPASPSPATGATGVNTQPMLTWTASGATGYDVAFGTTYPPPLRSSNQTAASYFPVCECNTGTPTPLAYSTAYFWQITARNAGGITEGPVWSFTTAAPPPSSPTTPTSPNPADAATGVSTSASLSWTASGATSYDVKFGTTNPPAQVVTGQTSASYAPAMAAGTTYFWQIVANNASGSTAGPIWSFATAAAAAPATPTALSPADGATGLPGDVTMTWTAAGATSYEVHFSRLSPPGMTEGAWTNTSYHVLGLESGTTYFWQIVARNAAGTSAGPVWSFTTSAATATPTSPGPADGATGVALDTSLDWTISQPEGMAPPSVEVSFGTFPTPPLVSSGQTATSYTPGPLAPGTRYYWRLAVQEADGTHYIGPTWTFTTAGEAATHPEVVIYASDIPSSALHGTWTTASDAASPNGVKLITPDNGWASTSTPLATPADYIDVTFTADANTTYTVWLRMKAQNDNKYNDSLWVQFSDAFAGGSQPYPLASTQGLDVNLATSAAATSLNNWGWQNGAYWLSQPVTVTFPTTGTHTMRIQIREDGVQLDQIVLSSYRFTVNPPGSVTNDSIIVPKP